MLDPRQLATTHRMPADRLDAIVDGVQRRTRVDLRAAQVRQHPAGAHPRRDVTRHERHLSHGHGKDDDVRARRGRRERCELVDRATGERRCLRRVVHVDADAVRAVATEREAERAAHESEPDDRDGALVARGPSPNESLGDVVSSTSVPRR